MNPKELFEAVQKNCKAQVSLVEEEKNSIILVEPQGLFEVMKFLKEDPSTHMECLNNQTASHEGEQIRVFYVLYSYRHKHEVTVEAKLPTSEPKIKSVVSLWRGADWLERETYDLLGVVFEGHPDLRRIMLPEDWEGFPLRKDYKAPTHYGGIDNTPSAISQSFKIKG